MSAINAIDYTILSLAKTQGEIVQRRIRSAVRSTMNLRRLADDLNKANIAWLGDKEQNMLRNFADKLHDAEFSQKLVNEEISRRIEAWQPQY